MKKLKALRLQRRQKRKFLGVLLVTAATFVILAAGRKWVVAGITILSFSLLILEFFGFFMLGFNDRIEVSNEKERKCSAIVTCQIRVIPHDLMHDSPIARRNNYKIDCIKKDQNLGKFQKLKRKYFRRKSRKQKTEIEPSRVESEEEYFSSEETNTNEVVGSSNTCVHVRDHLCNVRLRRWRNLLFIFLVLLGFLGGKNLMLVFTAAWYFLFGCSATVCCRKRWSEQIGPCNPFQRV